MTQRLTPEREAVMRKTREFIQQISWWMRNATEADYLNHVAELLDEVHALRAELAGACPDAIRRALGGTVGPDWVQDVVERIGDIPQASLEAIRLRKELAGAEERGRRAGLKAAGEHVLTFQRALSSHAGKRPKEWVEGYLTGVGVAACKIGEVLNAEVRGAHVRTGAAATDGGEPTPSVDPA